MTEPAILPADEPETPVTDPATLAQAMVAERKKRSHKKGRPRVIRRMIYRLEVETVAAIREAMQLTGEKRAAVFAIFLEQMKPQEAAARSGLIRRVIDKKRLELDNIAAKAQAARRPAAEAGSELKFGYEEEAPR